MAGTKGQRGYLSRLAEPMPAGVAAVKPAPLAQVADWRELVPEVLDTTPARSAADRRQLIQSRRAEPSFTAESSFNASPAREKRNANSPVRGASNESGKQPNRQSTRAGAETGLQTSALSAPVWRSAAALDGDVVSGDSPLMSPIAKDRAGSREPVAQAFTLPEEPTDAPIAHMSSTEVQSKPAAVRPVITNEAAANATTAVAADGHAQREREVLTAAPTAGDSHEGEMKRRANVSHENESNSAQVFAELVPALPAARPKDEPKSSERPPARVHIGKLEIRISAPPQVVVPPQPAPEMREPRRTPIAPTAAPQPLARELAWNFGLMQE